MNRLALVVSLFLTCSACTVGPKYQVPAPVGKQGWTSPQSTSGTTPPDLSQWWKTFHDEQLDNLITQASSHNFDLAAATDRVLESRANLGLVKASLYPSVNSTTQVTRQRQRFFAGAGASVPVLLPIQYNNFQTQWDASWEIDLFGRLRNSVAAGKADLQASEEDRHNVLLTLLSDVSRYYMMLRGDQQRLAIALRNIEIGQDTLQLTKDLARAGQSTQREVAQAAAQLNSVQSTVPQIETSISESIFRLSVLTGQEPGALKETLTSAKPLPLLPPEVPPGLPLQLVQRRPDVRTAEDRLRAATYRIGEAQADYFPRLTLTGTAGRQALQLHELSLGGGNIFNIGPSVTLPILDSGRIRNQVRLRQAETKEAQANFQSSVLRAFEDVEKALTELSDEQNRRALLEAQVKENQTALELSRVQYNAGLSDFLTVLTSERDLFAVNDQVSVSQTTQALDVVALYKALGGGWQLQE